MKNRNILIEHPNNNHINKIEQFNINKKNNLEK
jgi:hypothetical protein